jgi:tRNA G18 (ribose-2'-O)-methylase SpoU
VTIRSIQAIETLDLPELAPYRTLRQHEDHRRARIFVAEGEKVVRRLLESRLTVLSAVLPEKWFAELKPVIRARPEPVAIYTAPKKVLERLTGFTMYQGLLAVAEMPPASSLADALAEARTPRLFVAVDGLTSAENLGALVRNCAAFRTQALLVGETCGSPWLRRAVRASMGTIFNLPAVDVADLAAALHELREAGVRCVAAHPHVAGRTLASSDFRGDCCVVFGSEGYGLSPRVLAACDAALAVPMPPAIDSLNVASAAAVFLYEVNRQRGWFEDGGAKSGASAGS